MTNTKWTVDPTHSAIEFSVKHMMIAKVKGSFNKFEAIISSKSIGSNNCRNRFYR